MEIPPVVDLTTERFLFPRVVTVIKSVTFSSPGGKTLWWSVSEPLHIVFCFHGISEKQWLSSQGRIRNTCLSQCAICGNKAFQRMYIALSHQEENGDMLRGHKHLGLVLDQGFRKLVVRYAGFLPVPRVFPGVCCIPLLLHASLRSALEFLSCLTFTFPT